MWVNSNVQTESLFQESKFTNPWRSKKEKHKGMFFIIPTIFSSTNCCKQMKNRFSRILFSNLPNCSLPKLILLHKKSYLQQLWEWLLLVQQYSLSISSPKDSAVFPQSLSSLSLSHTEKQVVSFQSQNTAALPVFSFNWNFAIFNTDNTIFKNIVVFALHNASTAHKNLKDSFK